MAPTPRHRRADAASLARLDDLARRDRRRRFLETTPGERLRTALELSDLARELREGMARRR